MDRQLGAGHFLYDETDGSEQSTLNCSSARHHEENPHQPFALPLNFPMICKNTHPEPGTINTPSPAGIGFSWIWDGGEARPYNSWKWFRRSFQ
jgi:hypothetical protein